MLNESLSTAVLLPQVQLVSVSKNDCICYIYNVYKQRKSDFSLNLLTSSYTNSEEVL